MLGYQPWRCMKHNLIADVVIKPRWFLKIVLRKFCSKTICLFFTYELWKGQRPTSSHANCVRELFLLFCLLDYCVITRIPHVRTTKGGKVQHFHVPAVWLYISCKMINSYLDVWRPVSFSNQCLFYGVGY